MRLLFAMALVIGFVSSTFAETWTLNAEKSKIDFVGKKPEGAHKGGFKSFKAEEKADLQNPQ